MLLMLLRPMCFLDCYQVGLRCGHVPRGHHHVTIVAPSSESLTHRRRHQHYIKDQPRRRERVSSYQMEVFDVAHGLLSTRELFARLPDLLCRTEQLRVGRDEPCWNGTTVAP